jgi:hypothetical protein
METVRIYHENRRILREESFGLEEGVSALSK